MALDCIVSRLKGLLHFLHQAAQSSNGAEGFRRHGAVHHHLAEKNWSYKVVKCSTSHPYLMENVLGGLEQGILCFGCTDCLTSFRCTSKNWNRASPSAGKPFQALRAQVERSHQRMQVSLKFPPQRIKWNRINIFIQRKNERFHQSEKG